MLSKYLSLSLSLSLSLFHLSDIPASLFAIRGCDALEREGRRPNGYLGLSLNDRTILFLLILLDKTVSVRQDCKTVFALGRSPREREREREREQFFSPLSSFFPSTFPSSPIVVFVVAAYLSPFVFQISKRLEYRRRRRTTLLH